jgi:hypothetical protein
MEPHASIAAPKKKLPRRGGWFLSGVRLSRLGLSRNLKNRALEKNKSTKKISFCHDAWMYFSLPGMTTMLPKVLEIERHQLADYGRVDYAITKGEDEVAALKELAKRVAEGNLGRS